MDCHHLLLTLIDQELIIVEYFEACTIVILFQARDFDEKYRNQLIIPLLRAATACILWFSEGRVRRATQKSLQIFAAEQIPQRSCILKSNME